MAKETLSFIGKTKKAKAEKKAPKRRRRAKRVVVAGNMVAVTMKLKDAIRLNYATIKTARNAVLS